MAHEWKRNFGLQFNKGADIHVLVDFLGGRGPFKRTTTTTARVIHKSRTAFTLAALLLSSQRMQILRDILLYFLLYLCDPLKPYL